MFSFSKKKRHKGTLKAAGAADERGIPAALKDIPFTCCEGKNPVPGTLVLFGLTTCGFCAKALKFLEEHDVPFCHVHVDTLPTEIKRSVRQYVSDTFDTSITYPFLVIDNTRWLSGFLRVEWEELLSHE
jgi:glutaredoxin-like protein NrdH